MDLVGFLEIKRCIPALRIFKCVFLSVRINWGAQTFTRTHRQRNWSRTNKIKHSTALPRSRGADRNDFSSSRNGDWKWNGHLIRWWTSGKKTERYSIGRRHEKLHITLHRLGEDGYVIEFIGSIDRDQSLTVRKIKNERWNNLNSQICLVQSSKWLHRQRC